MGVCVAGMGCSLAGRESGVQWRIIGAREEIGEPMDVRV